MAKKKSTPIIVKGYKGFDKNMKCRGKQYEVGQTYEEPETSLCGKGMHFCEDPWDVPSYYPLGEDNRYAEVTAENPSDERDSDSKRVTRKLEIGVEIGISGWAKAAISYLFKKVEWVKDEEVKSNDAQLASSGYAARLASSGNAARLASSGNDARLASSGNDAQLASSGYAARLASSGNAAVVAGIGRNNMAKAKTGSWIVLAEYDQDNKPVCVKAVQVDGEKIKADVYYILKGGEFVEADDAE